MTSDRQDTTWSWRGLALAAVLVMTVAWALYRPELNRPFDILDFGEFLPYLKATDAFGEQVLSMLRYNAEQSGRANIVPTVAAALKWKAFGDWTPGWQLARAAVMLVLILQMYLLARRLGATQLGSLVAALTFLVAPAAARGWVRITMLEPPGMIVVLALTLRAFTFQVRTAWRREIVLYCGVSVFVILTKELMAPAIALPLAVALAHRPDGSFGGPMLSPRNVRLVIAVGLASLAALLPLVLLFLSAAATAPAAQYGHAPQIFAGVLAIWIATLAPFSLAPNPPSVMWAISFVAFVMVVAVGWRMGLQDALVRHRARALLTGVLLFSLLGALAYAPWPAYEERYAFPYLVATAVLLGMAVTYLQRSSLLAGRMGVAGSIVVGVVAASGAWAHAARADAVQRADGDVIHAVATEPDVDSVFVATFQAIVPEWTGLGPTLSRLAAATDQPWPPTRDIRCSEIAERLRASERIAVVSFISHCGSVPSREAVVRRFRKMDWGRWRIVDDSVRADVFHGAASMLSPH